MTITVSSGVTSSGLTISSGEPLRVLSGGVVDSSTILSGGSATLSSGALAEFLTVNSGGMLRGPGMIGGGVVVYGSVSGVQDYANLSVSGSATGLQVEALGEENVYSGGAAARDTILSGGFLGLSGGTVSDEVVDSGGTVELSATLSNNFTAGPLAAIESISGVTISSGGIVELNSATVLDGATLSLTSGGIAYGLTVSSGAVVTGAGELVGIASAAGGLSGVTIGGDLYVYAEEDILSGGTASGITVSGGHEDVTNLLQLDSGATATGTIVVGSAAFYDSGAATGTLLSDYGSEVIDAGGSDSGVTVASGGTLNVGFGQVEALIVENGGTAFLDPGTASGVTVRNGGDFEINDGTASAVTVESGATLKFIEGTIARASVRSGATFAVNAYLSANFTAGAVTSTTMLDGATVSSGGVIDLYNATVDSGVTVTLKSGGAATFLTVSSGGLVTGQGDVEGNAIVAGVINGVTVGDQVFPHGAGLTILSGGIASDVTILAGASRDENTVFVSGGGTATDLVIEAHDYLYVYGSAVGVQLESGASEVVVRGVDSGGTIHDGASMVVVLSGVASGADLLSGGRIYVSSGGRTVGAIVSSGGVERVLAAGAATSTEVGAGGDLLISSGGLASGVALMSGGVLLDDGEVRFAGAGSLAGHISGSGSVVQTKAGDLVLSGSGAGFTGKAVIEGGVIELATSGAIGTGYVEFAAPSTGSSVLRIDAPDAPAAGATFANKIDNFSGAGEAIDLSDLAFASGATATTSASTLTLTDGGMTYKFTLEGSVAGGYSVTSDGGGGTLIEATPTDAVVRFAQAAAAFAPTDAAQAAPVSANTSSSLMSLAHATVSAGAARF